MTGTRSLPEIRSGQKWAMGAAALLVEFGFFCIVAAAFEPLRVWTMNVMTHLWWSSSNSLFTDSPVLAWLTGLIGAISVGWGTTIFLIVRKIDQPTPASLVDALLISFMVWFVVDSAISAYTGAVFNVLVNLATLALFLVPLLAMRSKLNHAPVSAGALLQAR